MVTVYVLLLEKNKFYVGKTNDMERRLNDHMHGTARSAQWTRKYKPVRVFETYEGCDGLEEDKITLMYMIKYGIDHVRGGPYVSGNLSEATRDHIRHRMRMACDLCGICGSPNHFMSSCAQKKPRKATKGAKCETCSSPHHFTEDCQL